MEFNTLITILADMYNNAPEGEQVAMIHLFGVRYARDIQNCEESMRQMAISAGLNESYGTEIAKGVKLSRYVWPRP